VKHDPENFRPLPARRRLLLVAYRFSRLDLSTPLWRSMKKQTVELLPIDSVTPYPRNARIHSESNIAKIVASIKEFGWTVPILVDEDTTVLAGHGRLLAARALLMAQVPCLRVPGLSSAQKRAYRLADNRLTLDSDWDFETLKLELADLDFDLALMGFDQDELDDILGLNGPREGEDDTPALEKVAVSKLGEIWALGSHRLICADACSAAEVARLLAGVTPSVMVTDPPYGVEYDPDWRNRADRANGKPFGARAISQPKNDNQSDWSAAWMLFPGSVVYAWHPAVGALQIDHYNALISVGFEVRMQIIWAKSHFPIGRGHYHVQHESCWYAVRGNAHWRGDRSQTTLWEIDKPMKSETGLSVQKPVECMRRPIVNHTSSGQAVYDPFMGSGTTIIAAETTARVCYGCEINPLYVDMAIRRWQTFTGKEATRLADGRTFAELEAK
jgi:DNA modification methylase